MAQPRKLHDKFFKLAKSEGYAARSAYKLQEIVQRRRLISRGDWVLDLGCAPGSWVQLASKVVGDTGFVLGLDLKPVSIPDLPNARTLVGDVFKTDAASLLQEAGLLESPSAAARDRFDAVLSDMAPSTEGGAGGITDHFRSVELCRRVLEILPKVLRPGGNAVMKVFEGEAYPDLVRETQRQFKEARGFKPKASRDVSREMFIIALGYEPGLKALPKRPNPAIAAAPPAPRPGWGDAQTPGKAEPAPGGRGAPASGPRRGARP